MRLMLALLVASVILLLAGAAAGFVAPIQLAASAQGSGQVKLRWANATSPFVVAYRDGTFTAVLPSTRQAIEATIGAQPLGRHVYKVCERKAAGRCSNNSTVTVT